ncbi:MAG: hypothetical protein IJJ40_02325 [Clostridia bacterium]|nr:hypothetical protein [Clostridia bacterium]
MINLKLEVIRFSNEDVIATSAIGGGIGGGSVASLTGKKGGFYIPSSQYNGGSLGGEYVTFQGTFGDFDGSAYNIIDPYGFAVDVDERDGLMSGGSVVFYGVTIDMSDMAPIAKQYYDAFSYGDGQYYSNGVSYYESYWQ